MMGDYDADWFIDTLYGSPFMAVDPILINQGIKEASLYAPLRCAETWCPDVYPIALAIRTAIILYAQGEPTNTASGAEVIAPKGSIADYVSVVKSDGVGPLKRDYERVEGQSHNPIIPTLQARLDELLDGCKPPRGVIRGGSLGALNPDNCGCGSRGADKTIDRAMYDSKYRR